MRILLSTRTTVPRHTVAAPKVTTKAMAAESSNNSNMVATHIRDNSSTIRLESLEVRNLVKISTKDLRLLNSNTNNLRDKVQVSTNPWVATPREVLTLVPSSSRRAPPTTSTRNNRCRTLKPTGLLTTRSLSSQW